MSEAIVSSVVQTLTDLLKEETKFVAGVDGQVQGITDELKMLQSFLKDADARKIDDNTVRTWVERATEVAYQAEEVLETYVMEVQSKRRGGIIHILKRFACLLNEGMLLHKIGKEAQVITTRISQLTDQLDKYGIRSSIREGECSSSGHERQRQLRRSYSRVVEEDFVGLEGDVKNMVDHLVNEERDKYYQVLSICGMGGLGKTAIAQKIYNHPNVKRHFDIFVWVCISQKWDAWNCIKPAFPVGKTGSKILLTTRNIEVASQVDPNGFLYQPRVLSEDESWELLQKKALRNRESKDPSYTKKMELGKEMVKQCRGLPLAVVVLGGLLATKEALSEWDMVHKNVKSYLSRGKSTKHGGRVVDILALSYDDLPYQLKPCFLYLGNFEEDSEIEVERLYQLWMAEGMVSLDNKSEEETIMDVAERYLGELAQRCIVQVQVEEESSIRRLPKGGKIERLCQLIDHWKLPKGIGNLIHLRYLSLRRSMFLKFPSSFGNLKHLQTLDLRDVNSVFLWKVKVLRKMERLTHLYLPEFDVHNPFIVGKLWLDGFSELEILEYLDVDDTYIVGKVRLDGLSKLEILENFNPAYCEVKDLSTLNNLRELTVRVEEKLEDLRASILHVGNITQNHLRYLSLNIECRFCSEDELTLLTQLLGCPVLHILQIDGSIGKLPEHTHFSSSLTQLSLIESDLEEDPMATLEKLSNLHRLTLDDAFIGEEIVCSAMGFPQLKKLKQLILAPNCRGFRRD